MSELQKHHKELTNGVGKCSVPMWSGGCPDGFCDEPAYGFRPRCPDYYSPVTGQIHRLDEKYSGHVPGLACPRHGGPEKPKELDDGQA